MKTKADSTTTGSGAIGWLETTIQYLDQNRTIVVTDPMGHVTTTRSDVLGNPISTHRTVSTGVTLVDSTVVDNMGTPVLRIDPRQLRTSTEIGWHGNPLRTNYPDGQIVGTEWNMLGSLIGRSTAGPGGVDSVHFQYDGLGRILYQRWIGLDSIWNREWKYDSTRAGLPARASRGEVLGHVDVTYSYDVYGNMTQRQIQVRDGSTTRANMAAAFAYNTGGNRSIMALPGSTNLNYLYDDYNRLQGIDLVQGSATNRLLSDATYRGLGIRTGYKLGNTDIQIEHEDSRPLVLGMSATNSKFASTEKFAWDRAGNLTNWTHFDGEKASYTYDQSDRLVGVDYPSGNMNLTRPHNYQYAYDNNGNPTKFTHDFGTQTNSYPDSTNQVAITAHTARPVTIHSYDFRGNRSSETVWADSSTMTIAGADSLWLSKRTYKWSPENELIELKKITRRCGQGTEQPQCNGIPQLDTIQYRYSYDDNNRKILSEKLVAEVWTPQREYLWDGVQVVYERDRLSGERTYFAVDGINHVAEVHRDTNDVREILYRLNDHLGNLEMLLDTTGNRVGWYRHEPYGRLEGYAGTRSSRYTWGAGGKEFVEELGWMDFGRRLYDPTVGAWTTLDPRKQYANPYLYAGSRPLVNLDPDGLYDVSQLSEDQTKQIYTAIMDFKVEKPEAYKALLKMYAEMGYDFEKDILPVGVGPSLRVADTKANVAGSTNKTDIVLAPGTFTTEVKLLSVLIHETNHFADYKFFTILGFKFISGYKNIDFSQSENLFLRNAYEGGSLVNEEYRKTGYYNADPNSIGYMGSALINNTRWKK